jgi:hypothetical protein
MLHESSLADAADRLWEELPGHRVEILNGSIVVTPPPDGPHQETCSEIDYEFRQAGAREAGLRALPGIGLWLPTGPDDYAADDEAALVAGGLPYLHEVWADPYWRLFEVVDPTPLVEPPAEVISFDAAELVLDVSSPGTVQVRVPYSPWLSLIDAHGNTLEAPESVTADGPPVDVNGCLGVQEQPTGAGQPDDDWTLLHAPAPGIYRIAAPYKLPRGTACPSDLTD